MERWQWKWIEYALKHISGQAECIEAKLIKLVKIHDSDANRELIKLTRRLKRGREAVQKALDNQPTKPKKKGK